MRPAALAMGDKMRLANATLERTNAKLKGCMDRIKELQDRVGHMKRDGLLVVDSVSRRLPAPKNQVCFVKLPCDVFVTVFFQQKENCFSLHKLVQRVSRVSDAAI